MENQVQRGMNELSVIIIILLFFFNIYYYDV